MPWLGLVGSDAALGSPDEQSAPVALTTEAYGLTDVGRKRQHNEDAMLVDPELGLYIVADGMGGHAAGEVASERAVEVVKQHLAAEQPVLEGPGRSDATTDSRAAAASLVEVAVQRACADIYRMAAGRHRPSAAWAPPSCAWSSPGDQAVIGHVGDSRVYLVRNGQCHRLTEDHTLIAAQLKAGTITKEQAPGLAVPQRHHPRGRHPGVGAGRHADRRPAARAISSCSAPTGCTATSPTRRSRRSSPTSPLDELPARLVALANERGGKDNITAVVVGVAGDGGGRRRAGRERSRGWRR